MAAGGPVTTAAEFLALIALVVLVDDFARWSRTHDAHGRRL